MRNKFLSLEILIVTHWLKLGTKKEKKKKKNSQVGSSILNNFGT
jgi:hypothetical protein